MEQDYAEFHATVKLKNSEEIFSMISPSNEGDKTYLMLLNPVVIEEVVIRGQSCYRVEPWLKTSSSDMVILNLEDVLTVVECFDKNTIQMYNSFLRRSRSDFQKQNLSRKMGYISDIDTARKSLENLYKA